VTLLLRRNLLAFFAACLTASAWAQPPDKIPAVGVLVTHASLKDPAFDYLRAGLREYGWEEGRSIRLEIVTADGQLDRLPALAAQLVADRVDVILSPNDASVRAAREATSTIPIVMVGITRDPVAMGLIDSFRRPGGNVTGVFEPWVELDGKRLEILKETLPELTRVAVFRDPEFPGQPNDLQRAGQSLGLKLELIDVSGPQGLEAAFKVAKHRKVGAGLVLPSPAFYVHRGQVATIALDSRLPIIAPHEQGAKAGAMLGYGPDISDRMKRCAYYIDRLLKGAKASDLPVEQATKLKLVVNLRTVKALGVTIPESILLRADELIQ